MPQGKLVDPKVQQQVLTYIEVEKHPKWIMKKLGLSKSTFYDIAARGRVKEKNEYKTRPGRKPSMTKIQMVRIKRDLTKHPRTPIRKLRSTHKLQVSRATVSRVLRTIGIDRRKMRKIPKLTKLTSLHKKKRLEYALSHCDPHYDWSHWIWTDEKKFNLDGPDGYNYYWHVKGTEPLRYSTNASSKKSIMVWGGISKNGQTKLVKVVGRMDGPKYCTLLEEGLLPSYDDGDTFEQDRASSHTSQKCKDCCRENNIQTMYNPTKSPDLSPIENAWSWMAHTVYRDRDSYENLDELEKAIFRAWEEMPQDFIDRLIDSMPHRLLQVIERKGDYTDY
jgi:transposase